MDGPPPRNFVESVAKKMFYLLDAPVTWFRENVVVPNRKPIKYYHQKYRRVPTIDECYELDALCMYEANEQFKRDWKVDAQIISLLRERKIECFAYEGPDAPVHCKKVIDDYAEAELNFFIKYGDLGSAAHVKQAYMKQKHRMVHERRRAEGNLECPVVLNTE